MQVPFGFVMNLYWIFVLHVLHFGVKYGTEFSNGFKSMKKA